MKNKEKIIKELRIEREKKMKSKELKVWFDQYCSFRIQRVNQFNHSIETIVKWLIEDDDLWWLVKERLSKEYDFFNLLVMSRNNLYWMTLLHHNFYTKLYKSLYRWL